MSTNRAKSIAEMPRPAVNGNGHAQAAVNGNGHAHTSAVPESRVESSVFLSQEVFVRTLCRERRRTERSRKPFVLMLLNVTGLGQNGSKSHALRRLMPALCEATRETDALGWYEEQLTIGILFTEFGEASMATVPETLVTRLLTLMGRKLSAEEVARIEITCHVYPEETSHKKPGPPVNPSLYPDLAPRTGTSWLSKIAKRTMDVVGAGTAILLLSPVLLLIALLVKLSSPGPVLFRQQRIGQNGVPFTFYKFRSMQVVNDANIHREYVVQFIRGQAEATQVRGEKKVFKLTNDPRVTRVGRFIRRTSLDELPQFFNVLLGQMSLVGPRPPIPYELEAYDIWHRRRLLEAKPGITGLWQVSGRSRTSFDEMVRLDLQYATRRSLWLDLKILLRTPAAVLSGEGAH